MGYDALKIKSSTKDMVDQCRCLYLQVHPEFKEMPISYNKIVFEMAELFIEMAQQNMLK